MESYLEEPTEALIDEINTRRSHVLQKFCDFEEAALKKRHLLRQSCQFQHFQRNFRDISQSINDLIENAENILVKHNHDHLNRVSKLLDRIKSEAISLDGNVKSIESASNRLAQEDHYAAKEMQENAKLIREKWEYLMKLVHEKYDSVQGKMLSIEFCRKCEVLLEWMHKVRNVEWTPETNRLLFDDLRKKSIIWDEISAIYQGIDDPTPDDIEIYQKVSEEWEELQKFVDELMKEMDDHERISQFIETAEDIRKGMDEKRREMLDKYEKMSIEESLKYRKTVEIEIGSIKRRVEELTVKREELDGSEDVLNEQIEATEREFEEFTIFMKKWMSDVENKSDMENLNKEAEDILFWCSDKMEELSNMQTAESTDCDEIAGWIESNIFDLNAWDICVDGFVKNAQTLIKKNIEIEKVTNLLDEVQKAYELPKRTANGVNKQLEERVKTIEIEQNIVQTHGKATKLVSVLKNEVAGESSEMVEKMIQINDDLARRCESVVDQIEGFEKTVEIEKLSPLAIQCLDEMGVMKEILAKTCFHRKTTLQHKLDALYLLESSEELKSHTYSILESMKSEILKESKLKNSRNRIQPIRDQLDTIVGDFECIEPLIVENEIRERIAKNIEEIRTNINLLDIEHEQQLKGYDEKRLVDNTAKFVERLERWIEDSYYKINEDETDSPLESHNLRRNIAKCRHFLNASNGYKTAIEKRREEIGENVPEEAIHLLNSVQNSMERFAKDVQKWIEEREERVVDSDLVNELNSHNEWIKSKIRVLEKDPMWDNLLSAQKLSRRYENDSEEIENRRKNINDLIGGVKNSLVEEIETNWSRMKTMFDRRGSELERMTRLFEYDEESVNVWEWIREKMMYVDAIEPKEDEQINRIMLKKLEDVQSEVLNFEPTIVETHALLEDALIKPDVDIPISIVKYRNELVKKQGEIEKDYSALKRNIEKKLQDVRNSVQENEIAREISETEKWIEEEEIVLNRLIANDEKTENNELAAKLDDATTNLNRKRANLSELKCANVKAASVKPSSLQKIDDAFSMLDVFSFELDRMRQKVRRTDILRNLRAEADSVVDSILEIREKLEDASRSIGRKARVDSLANIDSDLETIKRRVIVCLEKAKEVRGDNAELAPAVYEIEKLLEAQWNDIVRLAEEKRKKREKDRIIGEIESDLMDLEQWIDTFNEEIAVVTASIHDTLGIQVGFESIDTWNEELAGKLERVAAIGKLIRQIGEEKLEERMRRVVDDVRKVEETIGQKNAYLVQFLDILNHERNCDWLHSWVVGKRRSLEEDLNNNQNTKLVIRKIGEIEKMMENRKPELDEICNFVNALKSRKTLPQFEKNELVDKVENLTDEWRQLEEDLKRRGVDFNDSMSQMYVEEEYEKIQQWIDRRNEVLTQLDGGKFDENTTDYEKKKKLYDTVYSEIRDFQPVYEEFLKNEPMDEEKVRTVRKLWSSLVETTSFKRKRLDNEMEKNRILDLLDSIFTWLTDADAEVRKITVTSLFRADDADKIIRKLVGIGEQANDKEKLLRSVNSVEKVREDVDELQIGISDLKNLIKMTKEDLDLWKDMQEVVKSIEDEICWFKEQSVIVSSSDVGHDLSSLEMLHRKHHRMELELERRKQKVVRTIDRTTEVLSMNTRESLYPKLDEIEQKVEQMEELIGNIGQLAEIRSTRLDRWRLYFELIDELKEKEQVLERFQKEKNGESVMNGPVNTSRMENALSDIESQIEIVQSISRQIPELRERALEMAADEIVRTRNAENLVEKIERMVENAGVEMQRRLNSTVDRIENQKFLWKCDAALQCLVDREERIANLVRQKRPTSNFENAQYQSTMSFVENYTNDTIRGLIDSSKLMRDEEGSAERRKRLDLVESRLNSLNRELKRLAERIENDNTKKAKVERLQDEYAQRAIILANWIEQAEEDVTDVDGFQTKEMTEEAMRVLGEILDLLRNEKVELLGELELIEVELLAHGEEVKAFTWHSYASLGAKMDKLAVTIKDRINLVNRELERHDQNDKICVEAAELLQKCRNVLASTKKELERLGAFSLDEQRAKLVDLSRKLRACGMIEELEEWRGVMDSRYIFDNPHSEFSPNGVLGDCCQCLELMQSMLRSVEQSIAECNACGVDEKQLGEFEHAFDYFDRERNGWLDYERFELCLKSQGYNFEIAKQSPDVLLVLDSQRSGRIHKTDYMRWMIKNETTNVCDDRAAIEEALKSLDAKKLSDSMSRKEADFFMRKIAHHTTDSATERVHIEYTDFVKSFY